jgi:ribonuclease-3
MKISNISQIKKNFKNKDLYDLAMTHRSWINENGKNGESNERLEFLGDAVLEYVVSTELYNNLPNKEEGFLTALRANIVNTENLSIFANKIDAGSQLKLSKGEMQSGGAQNSGLLANTVEAIIGAIYLDRGIDEVYKFITDNLLSDLDDKLSGPLKDPKSSLQETVQARGHMAPKYRVVGESGPDHNKNFIVEVSVDGKVYASGEGKSKNQAEQSAASNALEEIAK